MGYALKDENCEVRDEDAEKLFDLSVFNEDDNSQHVEKCSRILGCWYGLCGGREKAAVLVSDFSTGTFPSNHRYYAGLKWCSLARLGEATKSYKLGLKNSYAFEFENTGRLPILSDGKRGDVSNDAGGALSRWLEKLESSKNTNHVLGPCRRSQLCVLSYTHAYDFFRE